MSSVISTNSLSVPRVSTNYGKRSFFHQGAVLWNNLSLCVTAWGCNIVVILKVLLWFLLIVLFSYIFILFALADVM